MVRLPSALLPSAEIFGESRDAREEEEEGEREKERERE